MKDVNRPRLFGIAGYSGSGKTTLIEKLLPELLRRGLRVSVIKQTHHDVDLDQPGKDSWRHREAGAHEVLLTSSRRWVLLHELHEAAGPDLGELAGRLAPCDLVLVEGFRHAALPKLEVYRPGLGHPPLFPDDPRVLAVTGDQPVSGPLPWFSLHDTGGLTAFILNEAEVVYT